MYLEPKVVLQHLIEPRTSGRRGGLTDLLQETGSSGFPHPVLQSLRAQLAILYNVGSLKIWVEELLNRKELQNPRAAWPAGIHL